MSIFHPVSAKITNTVSRFASVFSIIHSCYEGASFFIGFALVTIDPTLSFVSCLIISERFLGVWPNMAEADDEEEEEANDIDEQEGLAFT